jgi:class 3 adenylate cyclase
MATFIHHKNPYSEELSKIIAGLKPTPGVCIFIDLINSTGDKYDQDGNAWISKLNNTFNFISFLNDFPNFVVKGIGDELMLYLPDADLQSSRSFNNYFSLLSEIYATMDTLVHHPLKEIFYECKVAIHYCTDVYNITFFEGVNDYYGIDIDMSARLMSKAQGNRVVMSEAFYKMVMKDVKNLNIDKSQTLIKEISKTYIEDFKGVPHPTEYRLLQLK